MNREKQDMKINKLCEIGNMNRNRKSCVENNSVKNPVKVIANENL